MFLLYIQLDGKNTIVPWNTILTLIKQHYHGTATDLIMANVNSHLSNAHSWAGNYQKAIKILNNTIPIYQQSLPIIQKEERTLLDLLRIIPFKNEEDDLIRNKCDLNFSLLILGGIQYYLGKTQEGINSYTKALALLNEDNLGKTSKYYKIDTLWDIGHLYIYAGQFVQAENILKEAKENIDKLYPNQRIQAYVYANLAFLMYHFGNFKEAILLLEKCAKIREKHLSPQHRLHIDTELKLGFINYMLGKTNFAKRNFIRANMINKLYNDDNLIKALINLGLGKIYETLGEYDNALSYMQNALEMAKLQFDDNINFGMSSQLTEAEIWPKTIKYTDLSYWEKVLKINSQMFGNNHYQTARYHYMLGLAMENTDKFQHSYKHYKQALAIIKTLAIKHPSLKRFHIENTKTIQEKIDKQP